MIYLIAVMLSTPEHWTFSYLPIQARNVAVHYDRVYLVEAHQVKILKQGDVISTFGSRGQGPGEFERAQQVMVCNEIVYVVDGPRLNSFDPEGNFINRISSPVMGAALKVQNGWIAYQLVNFAADSFELFHFSDTGKDVNAISEFSKMPTGSDLVDLTPSSTWVGTNTSGTRIFVHPAGGNSVTVLDVSGTLVAEIHPPWSRVHFDKEWGRDLYRDLVDKQRNTYKRMGLPFVQQAPYEPDTFPLIRRVFLDYMGRIIVIPWRVKKSEPELAVFDASGKPIDDTLELEVIERVLCEVGEYLVLNIYDSEEEAAGLVWVPKGEVTAFVKEHPLIFEYDASKHHRGRY